MKNADVLAFAEKQLKSTRLNLTRATAKGAQDEIANLDRKLECWIHIISLLEWEAKKDDTTE